MGLRIFLLPRGKVHQFSISKRVNTTLYKYECRICEQFLILHEAKPPSAIAHFDRVARLLW